VHTHGDPDHAQKLVAQTIAGMDPMLAVRQTLAGPDMLRARLARPRALSVVFGALATTALLLATLGLFGVLSAYVRERQKEIAIRSALGATPTQLQSLVATQTLMVAAVGVVCGAPLALQGPHFLHKAVSDAGSIDALTVLSVAALLLVVVVAATYGPMVRAARVDARTALSAD
jgi:putative ABC transport system permease protein